jgi:transketolase
VKIVASHGGITVGEDGASHHSIFDIALMRILPNMTVVVPADAVEAILATKAIAEYHGPVYMRTGRSAVPQIFAEDYSCDGRGFDFKLGRAVTLREGSDVALVATGLMVSEALSAADILEAEGVKARVIDAHTVKPLDVEAIGKAAKECGAVVTAEEHTVLGGLGGAVSEALAGCAPVPIEMVGVQDVFTLSGSPGALLVEYGLTSGRIVEATKKAMVRRS